MAIDPTRSLARQLARLDQSQRDKGSTPQLGTSSIENGRIYEYDINGQLKQTIGKQVDGTNTVVQHNGPPPPSPSRPLVTPGTESAKVFWDGEWSGGSVAPLDLTRIDVHLIADLDIDPLTQPAVASIAAAGWGEANFPVAPGTYYAVLVAWTTSGKWTVSTPSIAFNIETIVIPDPSDGVAPLDPPAITVFGSLTDVIVRAIPPSNPDPITSYNVYVNGVLTLSTLSNLIRVSVDSAGDRLPFDVDTTIEVSVSDADGEGPLSGPETARPIEINSGDIGERAIGGENIALHTIAAENVSAEIIVANDFYSQDGVHVGSSGAAGMDLTPSQGYRQRDLDGVERIAFPTASSTFKLDGDVTARGLTVLGQSSFRGQNNEISRNSSVTLAKGTTAPTSAPSASTPSWANTPHLTAAPGDQGFFDGTNWLFLCPGIGTYSAPRIGLMNSATGAVTYGSIGALPSFAGTYNDNYSGLSGIVKIGTEYFLLMIRVTPPFGSVFTTRKTTLYKLNSSFNVVASTVLWTDTGFGATNSFEMAVDGGQLAISSMNQTTGNTQIQNYSTSLAAVGSPVALPSYETGPFMVGNFDFGSKRYIFSDPASYNGSFKSFNAAGALQASEGFQAHPLDAFINQVTGFGWDGTRFVVFFSAWDGTAVSPHPPIQSSTRTTALVIDAAISWFDSDSTGGQHETLIGPVTTITLPARSGAVTFTAPPPADDGTSDAPDSSRLYVGLTGGTLHLQPTSGVGNSFLLTVTIADPNTSSGATPPVANSFPDGVAARLQSATGASYIGGDGLVRAADFGAGGALQDVVEVNVLGDGHAGPFAFTSGGDADLGGTVLGGVVDPLLPTDAATKAYVDRLNGGAVGLLASRFRSTVQTLSTSTTVFTPIDFDTAIVTDGIPWDATNKVFTAPKTGRYHVSLDVRSQTTTSTYFILRLVKNGSTQLCRTLRQPAVGWDGVVLTKTIKLAANDTLSLQAQMQAGAGGVFGDANQDTNVSIVYLGP